MRNSELRIYEVEFSEHGSPKEPDYRWFSSIGHALEFMHGITNETFVVEMKFRAHSLEGDAGGLATFLNRLTGSRRQSEEEIPF